MYGVKCCFAKKNKDALLKPVSISLCGGTGVGKSVFGLCNHRVFVENAETSVAIL